MANIQEIDRLARKYYKTKDIKIANELIKLTLPIIDGQVNNICKDSIWDKEDLRSTLMEATYILLSKKWVPIEDKEFHMLLFKHIKHITSNWIKGQQTNKGKILGNSVPLSDNSFSNSTSVLYALILKDTINSLYNAINNDYTTYHARHTLIFKKRLKFIVDSLLDGVTIKEIISKLNISYVRYYIHLKELRQLLSPPK